MQTRKYKVGDEVKIVFWDHSEGSNGESRELLFQVMGRIRRISPKAYHIASWDYANAKHPMDHNIEPYAIVKGTIEEMWIVSEEEE